MDSTAITATSDKPTSLSSLMTSPSPSLSPFFSPSPIPEQEEKATHKSKADNGSHHHHQPTPLHPSSTTTTPHHHKKKKTPLITEVTSVSCTKCRPSPKKPSVVPISPSATSSSRRITPPSPLSLLNSFFHRRNTSLSSNQTPQSISTVGSSTDDPDPHHWRITATELSKKLVAATRKRDDAISETSKLKYSLSELELKLARLESSYRDLTTNPNQPEPNSLFSPDPFIQSVFDSRAASRALARALSSQLRKNPLHGSSGLLPAHMESFLNRVFFSGFELDSEEEIQVVDPIEKCELNKMAYESIHRLTWEEVLTKGTKHFSEGLSRFCDSKMSDVVGSIGWTKAWPEPLLQAFFQAAKSAWLVRLLARSVHPAIPIIRVDRGARFDSRFMEDVSLDRVRVDLVDPVSVKMLVAPGFHVYTAGKRVVKCKVLCLYNGCRDGYRDGGVADPERGHRRDKV